MVDGVSIDFMPHASQDHMIIQDQRLVSGQIELPFGNSRSTQQCHADSMLNSISCVQLARPREIQRQPERNNGKSVVGGGQPTRRMNGLSIARWSPSRPPAPRLRLSL